MFIKDLQKERSQLQQLQKQHIEKLNALDNPPGILLCHKHANGFRWQHKYLRNGRPVTINLRKTEKSLAEKLAVNLYRIVCIMFLQNQISYIDSIICVHHSGEQTEPPQGSLLTELSIQELSVQELFRKVQNYPRRPAEFFDSESPYKPLILSYLLKEYADILNWYLGDFKKYNEHPEHLQFQVKLGFKVRSKSEVIIADRLFQEGILFHYEELLPLSGDDSWPDCYIPITAIEKYAWEHFGAMDKENYFSRTKSRILNYLNNNWFPGINMITTYETKQHPLTEEMVDQKVRWLKSRYRLAFPDLPPDESFNMYDLAAVERCNRC